MDPAEAIASANSNDDAPKPSAPDAAHWLTQPTAHDDSPTPGSEDWWMQTLLRWGRALKREDAELWGEPLDDEPIDPHLDPLADADAEPEEAAS
jgi:hypothetical protein